MDGEAGRCTKSGMIGHLPPTRDKRVGRQQHDLGIKVDNKLKFHIHTAHINVNKGFSILGIIKSFKDIELARQLHYHRHSAQHRATGLVLGFDKILSTSLNQLNYHHFSTKEKEETWFIPTKSWEDLTESIQLSSSNSCHRKSIEATASKSTNNKLSVRSAVNHTEYEWQMTGIPSQQMWQTQNLSHPIRGVLTTIGRTCNIQSLEPYKCNT